ncbi:MAG: HIT family protein [Acholeplasmatales bacterium]|nr:MAG: HIT family protein [Acholeplasmatales bacterium]
MKRKPDCLFCKIIAGEIPSYKVYEDEKIYAFLDISQGTRGHTLIVPKAHADSIYDLEEAHAAALFALVPKLSNQLKRAFNPIGINLISNNEQPYQTVGHFHLHLLPRYEGDGLTLSMVNRQSDYDQQAYVEVLDTIKAAQ